MNTAAHENTDPREKGSKPPFDNKPQPAPGSDEQMNPPADFGEHSYRGSGKLEGRVALITGADSGIGRAVALAFAREGADIAFAYLNEDRDARETIRLVEESGRRALAVAGDIQQREHCTDLIHQTLDLFGRLDILVNNAAYQKPYESMTDMTDEELDRTFRTNIFSMFYLCREAVSIMKPGSSIINVASIQAYQPSAMLLPYATTKGAIVTFTKGLSEECIKKGIRVNAVAPGPVWTPLIASAIPEEKMKKFGQDNPTGRPGQPREMAPVFVLLASDDGSYINGEVIGVTGGKFLG